MLPASTTVAGGRGSPARGARGPALVVVLVAGAVFVAVSLWPWRQLVGAAYLLRFAGFAAVLGAVAWLLATAAGRVLGRRGPPAGLAAAAALAVFAPVRAWNDNGDIDVVMLHLDSLRADHCSAWGYARETTPHLAALAERRGVRFERFFAQSGGTDKSVPAMLASLYPSMFCDPDVEGHAYVVPARFPLLSEHLAREGWRCWAFSANPQVNAARGHDRGFEALEPWWQPPLRPHELMARLRAHLEGSRAPRNFVYGVVLDPHMPYTPEPRFDLWSEPDAPDYDTLRAMNLEQGVSRATLMEPVIALYDAEIREMDDAIGGLVGWLEESGRIERTLLLLLADHGEKFLEHGEYGHGGMLYDDVTHVPLVATFPSPLRFPRLEPAVRVYEGIASHVDLLPTVLGFVGAPAREPHVRGRDLLPYLYGREPVPEGDVFIEELTPGFAARVLRTRTHKAMVWRRGDEREQMALFDLVADPDELAPIGPGAGGEAGQRLLGMRAEIERRRAEALTFFRAEEHPALDRATLEALEAIGYTR